VHAPATTEEVDVVVVGARCAGAATAMLLARQGLRVVVVDRGERGRDTTSTHALLRGAVVQLDRWGLLATVRAAGTPAVRQAVFHYGDAATTVPVGGREGSDPLYAPRRTVLDPILVDAARAAGADVRFGTTVTGLVREARGRVAGVRVRGPRGGTATVRARLTVGADGRGSPVARAVGAPVLVDAGDGGAVAYAHVLGLGEDAYEWWYRTGLTAGLIPTNDERACVFVGASAPRLRAEVQRDASAGFLRLLAAAAPPLADAVAAAPASGRVRTWVATPSVVRRPWGPGWALVGDAGSSIDPLSAHGITDALRDAELLARVVVAQWHDIARDGSVLQPYQEVRDRLSAGIVATTAAIASYEWTTATVEPLVRQLSAAMNAEVAHLRDLEPPVELQPAS
jgi:2-polyprenyl-6-methoxyphenol hydroxylase-like FAD-dependent oxidoreductase